MRLVVSKGASRGGSPSTDKMDLTGRPLVAIVPVEQPALVVAFVVDVWQGDFVWEARLEVVFRVKGHLSSVVVLAVVPFFLV